MSRSAPEKELKIQIHDPFHQDRLRARRLLLHIKERGQENRDPQLCAMFMKHLDQYSNHG